MLFFPHKNWMPPHSSVWPSWWPACCLNQRGIFITNLASLKENRTGHKILLTKLSTQHKFPKCNLESINLFPDCWSSSFRQHNSNVFLYSVSPPAIISETRNSIHLHSYTFQYKWNVFRIHFIYFRVEQFSISSSPPEAKRKIPRSSDSIDPFSHVQLHGQYFGLVRLQPERLILQEAKPWWEKTRNRQTQTQLQLQ